MIDRKKVITGVDICLSRFHCGKDCPYYNAENRSGCMELLRKDALELLKEQESEKTEYIWGCPNCGSQIIIKTSKANSAIGVCLTVCPICRNKVLYGKVK